MISRNPLGKIAAKNTRNYTERQESRGFKMSSCGNLNTARGLWKPGDETGIPDGCPIKKLVEVEGVALISPEFSFDGFDKDPIVGEMLISLMIGPDEPEDFPMGGCELNPDAFCEKFSECR